MHEDINLNADLFMCLFIHLFTQQMLIEHLLSILSDKDHRIVQRTKEPWSKERKNKIVKGDSLPHLNTNY